MQNTHSFVFVVNSLMFFSAA